MLKNKKKKIFMIPVIIILLILLFFVIRILAFKVIIYPHWLTQSSDNISEVHISSEFFDSKITDQEMVIKLYKLCNNTKIKKLVFDTSESNANMSDDFSIDFIYKNNSSDTIMCKKMDATVLKEPANALFWTRGEDNEELLSLLLEIESSDNSYIKTDREQIFTDVEECLKEYEQDFDKIISLAKADKSAQKEEGSGSISLTRNSLLFSNSELEEHVISLLKKTKVSSVAFGQNYVSFVYKSQPEYLTSILYDYNDNKKEEESLGKIVKRIKPFYYMECLTLSNK
ncbi:MAG: hypothetical protein J1F02_04160 [Lachnospiraceae bacterium]|nr:hypothetical protein [Lachnospiraceae bacterium]